MPMRVLVCVCFRLPFHFNFFNSSFSPSLHPSLSTSNPHCPSLFLFLLLLPPSFSLPPLFSKERIGLCRFKLLRNFTHTIKKKKKHFAVISSYQCPGNCPFVMPQRASHSPSPPSPPARCRSLPNVWEVQQKVALGCKQRANSIVSPDH